MTERKREELRKEAKKNEVCDSEDSDRYYDSVIFSQDIYCGGYSGEDPPLPIPNREVKLTIADGTAPPGGRVGSCHALTRTSISYDVEVFCCSIEFYCIFAPQYTTLI